jgi:hypothetical protein
MSSLALSRVEERDFTLFIARYASANPDRSRVAQLLHDSFSDATAARIQALLEELEGEWNYQAILAKAWPLYRDKLVPAFLPDTGQFTFVPATQGSESKFWKQCLCFLALWKFPGIGDEHRPIGGSLRPIQPVDLPLLSGLEDYRERMREIWTDGRGWLDTEVRACRWLPPDPFDVSRERGSVEELAMYVFVRSHLAWENLQATHPVPLEAIRSLVNVRRSDGLWPNSFLPSDIDASPPSLRASAFAVAALGDWYMHPVDRSAERVQNGGVQVVDSNDLAVPEHVREACEIALRQFAGCQLADGSWGDVPGSAKGDLWTTSQVFYACNRFAQHFKVEIPAHCLDRAEMWLLSEVADRINSTADLEEPKSTVQSIAEVALALTALARQTGLGATIWLRQVIRWLFEARTRANSLVHDSVRITFADVWLLYSVIEVIRRARCAALLASPRVI